MTREARWVRASGKRPLQIDGAAASSTNPSTWSSYREAIASPAGDGFGIMLGGGLGCYDLDHVTLEQLRAFVAGVAEPILFIERSMSGDGFHVFVEAEEGPGRRTPGLERYTRDRFIRMTGDRVLA